MYTDIDLTSPWVMDDLYNVYWHSSHVPMSNGWLEQCMGHFQKMSNFQYTHAKIFISNGNFSCNGLNESLSDLWFRTLIINKPYIYFDKIKLHLRPILGVFVCVHCQKNTFQMIFFPIFWSPWYLQKGLFKNVNYNSNEKS